MRRRHFRVRTLLIAVAVLALPLGGSLEFLRLRRLSEKYRYIAWAAGNNVAAGLAGLAALERRYQPLRGLSDAERARLSDEDRALLIELPIGIERHQVSIAANANLVLIYEHAASHPWESPPDVVWPIRDSAILRSFPVVRRYLAGQPAPRPPTPPEYQQPPPDPKAPPIPRPPPPLPQPPP